MSESLNTSDTAAFVPTTGDVVAKRAAAEELFNDIFAKKRKVWTEEPSSLEEAVNKKRETHSKLSISVTDLSGIPMEFSMEAADKVADLKTAIAYKKCEDISGASKTRDPRLWVRVSLLDGNKALDDQQLLADLEKDDGEFSLQCLVGKETLDPWLVGSRGERYRQEEAGDNNKGRKQKMRNEANDDKSGHVPSKEQRDIDDIYCRSW